MSRFSTEPPELEATLEDFFERSDCDRCDASEIAPEGELPKNWEMRGVFHKSTLCPDCVRREDYSEARYDVERED